MISYLTADIEHISELKGAKKALQNAGFRRPLDLLYLAPKNYEDKRYITPIFTLTEGQTARVSGQVQSARATGRIFLAHIFDGTGDLRAVFFQVYPGIGTLLQQGKRVELFGQMKMTPYGLQMSQPQVACAFEPCLTPIYPSIKGISNARLHSMIGALIDALPEYDKAFGAPVAGGMSFKAALDAIHRPALDACANDLVSMAHAAHKRLITQELWAHQLNARMQIRQRKRRRAVHFDTNQSLLERALIKEAGFVMTEAQTRAVAQMHADLAKKYPMRRLLQGDVGSGKTYVSAHVAARVLAGGYKVAFMAPTEVLAGQHLQTFTRWFEPLGIPVVGWMGKMNQAAKKAARAVMEADAPCIAVGTHALFYDQSQFLNLGLVIIDEEHKFGVDQRERLIQKGKNVHTLAMTATPIPRTLALSAYGDMDVSIIDALPKGRIPIQTVTIARSRVDEVIAKMRIYCDKGNQAYWVCPLVDASKVDAAKATETFERFLEAGFRVGLLHGRLSGEDKRGVLTQFLRHEFDILVATTVVEVGVDIPNASLMIIENPERLGLAQLHQLRGRVGRGAKESFCVLLHEDTLTPHATLKLGAIRNIKSGFELAEVDLKMRGAGELLGTRQVGASGFYWADLSIHAAELETATAWADHWLKEDAAFCKTVIKHWR